MNTFIPISPTALGTMRTCPRQFEQKYVTREVQFQPSAATEYGNRLHKALELRTRDGTPFSKEFEHLEPYAALVIGAQGDKFFEHRLAIDAARRPCPWSARWAGAVADLLIVRGDLAIVLDYKSGKTRDDPMQLQLLTLCVFAHHPEVKRVKAGLVFFQGGDTIPHCITRETCAFPQLEQDIADYTRRIAAGDFPPKPSGLCREWCDCRCEHNGRVLHHTDRI